MVSHVVVVVVPSRCRGEIWCVLCYGCIIMVCHVFVYGFHIVVVVAYCVCWFIWLYVVAYSCCI